MVQPSSWPPPIASPIPSQLPPQPLVMGGGCDGCKLVLTTEPGFTQSVCHICALSQILPADGIRANQVQAHGVDPTKIQLPCANCKTIVSVAHGSSSLNCPRCFTNISVDSSKIGKVLPPVSAPPPLEEVNEVVSEVEREEDEGGVAGETFTDYRPSKLSIGPPHPDPIVETSSLSAVQPPIPTYNLKIKDNLEISKALSCLQIEAMVYACQRHLHHLPDGARAGFLLGDGAGVGKGRTIAGLIWENWNHGRRKTLWISVGSDLLYDAQRDLNDVGATCINCNIMLHALNKLPYSKLDSNALKVRDGVVFLTYTSLIACNEKGHSRLNQLVQWFGGQFDGLLVFDECHKAKNLVPEAGLKPTKTGKAVLEIQAKLLQARVVYCSATGASEPRNLGYMTRLGFWGAGTAFIDFSEFLVAMEKWGVGALELVAMDMKARGMYVCRTLSYKDAEFEVVEVSLDNKMMDMYGKATEFWVQLRLDLISASAHVAHAPAEKMLLWRLHWANHQRFFRHMCMSAKVPAVIRLSEKALVENKCVVIGLQSTGEARTEEAITKYGLELDDFISGPRELLLNFVERYYPLPDKPEPLPERTVIGLCRKRGPAMSDAALTETVAKVVKLNYASEEETDSQSESDAELETESDDEEYCPLSDKPEPLLEGTVIRLCRKRGPTMPNASLSERVTKVAKWNDESEEESELQSETDSEPETESDDELWICNVCITGEDRKTLLQCSCCNQFFHPACLIPPVVEVIFRDWSCYSCKEKMEEEARAKQADYEERLKRYEAILERKVKIIEKIQSLDLPTNPLDDIINQLGGPDKVAEITGRRGMLVRASEGKGVIYLARNTKDVTMEMVNMHEKKLFMDGNKLIAIISEAGSAGVSLQADRRAGNQKRRVHLTIELPWSADRAIQQFGRTHRSNQTSAPQYRLLFTNLGGECRFASIVAKRLERLGALTQGDRRAGPSLNAYNYDSVHGKRALGALYRVLMEEESFPVIPQGCSSLDKFDSIEDFILKGKTALVSVGIIKDSGSGKEPRKISGYISDKDMHDVGRFLNRLLGMAPEIQKRLFESFVSIFDILIEKARVEGHFDCGIVNMRANIVQLQGTPKTVHVDSMSGASTMLYTFTLDRGMTWESAAALLEEKQRDKSVTTIAGYYESKREWMGKRLIILAIEDSASKRCKIYRPATGESIREMSLADLKVKYRKVSASKNVSRRWDYENDASSKQCMHGPNCKLHKFCTVGRRLQEVNVLCGLILPIWGNIVKVLSEQARVSHRQIRIVHIETTSDSKRIVGLLVPNAAVESLLQDLSWVQDSVDQ